jgi:hypothetical protein
VNSAPLARIDAQHQLYKTNTRILIIALPLTLVVLFAVLPSTRVPRQTSPAAFIPFDLIKFGASVETM